MRGQRDAAMDGHVPLPSTPGMISKLLKIYIWLVSGGLTGVLRIPKSLVTSVCKIPYVLPVDSEQIFSWFFLSRNDIGFKDKAGESCLLAGGKWWHRS